MITDYKLLGNEVIFNIKARIDVLTYSHAVRIVIKRLSGLRFAIELL